METKLFVGNLPWSARKEDLFDMFSQAGEVVDSFVLFDRETRKSRGFAFIVMADEAGADKAIEMYEGYDYEGRPMKVNVARPREDG